MAKKETHSKNYKKVKQFYDRGLWSKDRVHDAVTNPEGNPWITEEEYEEITGEKYKPIAEG